MLLVSRHSDENIDEAPVLMELPSSWDEGQTKNKQMHTHQVLKTLRRGGRGLRALELLS